MATNLTSADTMITRVDASSSPHELRVGGGRLSKPARDVEMRDTHVPRHGSRPLLEECETDAEGYETASDLPIQERSNRSDINSNSSTTGEIINKPPSSLPTSGAGRNYGSMRSSNQTRPTHEQHGNDTENHSMTGTDGGTSVRTVSTMVDREYNDCCIVSPCCTRKRTRCYCFCATLSIVLIALFLTVAGLTLAWGVHSAEPHEFEPSSSLDLSALGVMNITSRHDGLYYKEICLNNTSDSPLLDITLGWQNCDQAFTNLKHTSRPFSGLFDKDQGFSGLLFYWLEGTKFTLHLNTNSTVYILTDQYKDTAADLVEKCENIAHREETPPDNVVHCLLDPNANQTCILRRTLAYTGFYHICIIYQKEQVKNGQGYNLTVKSKEFDFDKFSQVSCPPSGTPCCQSYGSTIFKELESPRCMFIKTTTANTTLLGSSVSVSTQATRRIDELYYFVTASTVLFVLMAVSTFICVCIMYNVGRGRNVFDRFVRFRFFKELPQYEPINP